MKELWHVGTSVDILKRATGIVALLTDESNSVFVKSVKLEGGLLSVPSMFQDLRI